MNNYLVSLKLKSDHGIVPGLAGEAGNGTLAQFTTSFCCSIMFRAFY